MNVLSAGEVTKGMYVIVLEVKYYRSQRDEVTGKVYDELVEDKTPWYRGIPFRVINVNGPMVAVDTSGLHKNNFNRVMFFDTRYYQLIETTKEFHDEYVGLMREGSNFSRIKKQTKLLDPIPLNK
jgi:hypothetical protein